MNKITTIVAFRMKLLRLNFKNTQTLTITHILILRLSYYIFCIKSYIIKLLEQDICLFCK